MSETDQLARSKDLRNRVHNIRRQLTILKRINYRRKQKIRNEWASKVFQAPTYPEKPLKFRSQMVGPRS